jgi:hypothetical protein
MKHRPSRAVLVTVTPGHELVQAFGHAAIAFDEGELVAYSYGGYVLPKLRPNLASGDLWQMVGATTFETLLPIVNRTMRADKVREPLAHFKQRCGPFQRVLADELQLTPEQREGLYQRLREDFARIEPDERAPGIYRYDHFSNNCVTRLRDAIFGVLSGDQLDPLQQPGSIDQSYEQVIEESLAAAIAASPLGVELFPPELEDVVCAFLPGISALSATPADFLGATRLALEQLGHTTAFSSHEGRQALSYLWRLLNVEIPKRPRNFSEALFTPIRFREGLSQWHNPATGRPLLTVEQIGP